MNPIKRKPNAIFVAIALAIASSIVFLLTRNRPVAASAIPGTYVCHFSFGDETLVLQPDGNMSQKLVEHDGRMGGFQYGRWRVDPEVKTLTLENGRDFADGMGGQIPRYGHEASPREIRSSLTGKPVFIYPAQVTLKYERVN